MVEIQEKEVISIIDGTKIGYVGDIEIDSCTGRVISVIVFGKGRFFGLFGKCEDTVIPWEKIKVIGEETILVSCEPCPCKLKPFFSFKLK